MDQLTAKPRLVPIDDDGEFVWTACVLRLFSEKLGHYVQLRDQYYAKFVSADYGTAKALLDSIEAHFGFSLWSIQNRLQLLQIQDGLKAQKDYLERILSTSGINSLSAWVSYFFSLRSEENVSFAKLETETNEVANENLGDYVYNHILPYDLTKIDSPAAPINWEEPNPIIDRFETFVSMAQVKLCRPPLAVNQAMLVAVQQLEEIGDARIGKLALILDDAAQWEPDRELVTVADNYTRGDYRSVATSNTECLELVARARIFLADTLENGKGHSLREQIVTLMQDVLNVSSSSTQSKLQLKKIALSCPKHTYALQIASFLERDHNNVLVAQYSELDRLAAINSPFQNPWNAPIISEFPSRRSWLDEMANVFPQSTSLRLRKALENGESIDETGIFNLVVPAHRIHAYAGHIAFNRSQFDRAIQLYRRAAAHDINFVSSNAKRHLYDAYYALKDFSACLTLIVTHVLRNPLAVHSYPIEALAKVCLETGEFFNNITFAILLHLNVIHIHYKWERELSDIFENVLFHAGVEFPSQMAGKIEEFDRDQIIYFLRFIATPRLLDDTTSFDSVNEIEVERISICQHLLGLDADNTESYLAEIRAVTRDINVAHLLKKVQTSKIFVDEVGVRTSVEPLLRDAFLRYLQLLDSPALAYQAEKLSKRLEEMLTSKGHAEFKDLRLPASEREALFLTMLSDFSSDFAFNPAYGLDTHVSTSIRHGAFEGHLRSPLAAEDLLCKKRDKEYLLPAVWSQRLDELTNHEWSHIQKQLGRFTQKIEQIISSYLKDKLHVRQGGNTGMFVFQATPQENLALISSITAATDYNTLIDKFFIHCWSLVDHSMENIRTELRLSVAQQFNVACDALVSSLDGKIKHQKIAPLVDAVVRAQTSFHVALADVADWFRRPQDLSRDPFDFEVAVHVALKQIENCYVKTPLAPKLELNVFEKIEGKLLDGICEIFFILLQNVILHSGFGEQQIDVMVAASEGADSLVISCTNSLAENVCLETRRALADEATGRYERDSALKRARTEGGSGLSKIWRIAEFDLRLRHTVDILVNETRSFTTTVTLSGLTKRNANVYN